MPYPDHQFQFGPSQPFQAECSSFEIDGNTLHIGKGLNLTLLENNQNKTVGCLIGFAYHAGQGAFLSTDAECASNNRLVVTDITDLETNQLPLLGGSFVLFTFGELPKRIYPDHAASIPVYFHEKSCHAASSISLLLNQSEYDEMFDLSLHNRILGGDQPGAWIPGTLTAHKNIKRLLPNHYLDLADLETKRYWPLAFTERTFLPIDEASDRIVNAMSAFIEASCTSFKVAHTLTAGYDSRLLLATSKNCLDKTEFFTMETKGNAIDVDLSEMLSKKLGFRHRSIPIIQSTKEQQDTWNHLVGNVVNEINKDIFPTLNQINEENFIVTGTCGEVGRCFLYKRDAQEINTKQVSAENLCSRLKLQKQPEILRDFDEWLKKLPALPTSTLLDLAYLELRCASWGMSQNPMQNEIKYNLYPFTLRPVIEAFIFTSAQNKKDGRLFDHCIQMSWPELSAFPINRYGNYRDLWNTIKSVYRKLKKYLIYINSVNRSSPQ